MTTTAATPGGISIRRATRADLLEVHRIETASFTQPWPYHAFEEFLHEPGFLVAFDRSVLGHVVADTVPNHGRPIGHVKDLAVHPDHWGDGLGTRLLDRALEVLAAEGVRRTKLEVRRSNDRARSLYRRFGFEHSHTVPGYYDDGEDALIMLVDLSDR